MYSSGSNRVGNPHLFSIRIFILLEFYAILFYKFLIWLSGAECKKIAYYIPCRQFYENTAIYSKR